VGRPLDAARAFVQSVQARDPAAAAAVCTEDVEVRVPGFDTPFQGKEGVRQMIRMAPAELLQTLRGEEERGNEVRVTTLTRAPGIFANYTTWVFETDGERVRRLSFELRGAN